MNLKKERVKKMCEYKFPVAIGDTVKAVVEDENHVVKFVPYEVKGVAQIGEKQYVIDEDNELNEIGTRWCLLNE